MCINLVFSVEIIVYGLLEDLEDLSKNKGYCKHFLLQKCDTISKCINEIIKLDKI